VSAPLPRSGLLCLLLRWAGDAQKAKENDKGGLQGTVRTPSGAVVPKQHVCSLLEPALVGSKEEDTGGSGKLSRFGQHCRPGGKPYTIKPLRGQRAFLIGNICDRVEALLFLGNHYWKSANLPTVCF